MTGEELRGLVAKATRTPWTQDGSSLVRGDLVVAVFGSGYTESERDDAALAVAAVNELVPLLDRLEAAEAMPPDAVLRNFAEAVGAVTPCLCSAQRARADAAEAERDALAAKVARVERELEAYEEQAEAMEPAGAFVQSIRFALAGDL